MSNERQTLHLDDFISGHVPWFLNLDQICGKTIIANGCFDILHPGHLRLLANLDTLAYKMKLRPIVALNSDESIVKIKGPSRPLVPQESRSQLLNYLKWPFTVVLFDEESVQRLMDVFQPFAVLKGAEYPIESVVKWKNSEVITTEMLPSWSTTRIAGDTR
jgi:cytidyltransferase-like protein